MSCSVSNQTNINNFSGSSSDDSQKEFLEQMAQLEDQTDYNFIQRVIQDLTQSCALPLPIPATSIPPLIIQAAQFFWENCDFCVEERWYVIRNHDIQKCGPNKIIKLPPQIIAVGGCYKATNNFHYGAMGDFSLERMILNNTALASGVGGSMSDVFGSGTGYNLMDITAGLYEVQTYKALFDYPLTYNFNEFSSKLVLLGDLAWSDLVLDTFQRCKIQDLYKNYYFFRYVVCLAKKSMSTIMGTFEFKLPGGVTLNHDRFQSDADTEIQEIKEWINKHHAADYFFNSVTI